jgi:hypothetical protein
LTETTEVLSWKLRDLPRRIRVRLAHVGKGERSVVDVDEQAFDAVATGAGQHIDQSSVNSGAMAPVNWVPSQQDERP